MGPLIQLIRKHGLYIFPVERNRKKPEIADWERKATNDLEQIQKWSEAFPDCNWGIATGPSGLIVLDSDVKNGTDGIGNILSSGNDIPATLTISTPSGGLHRYYRGTGRNRAGFIPGNDIRSSGGYVVAPFSKLGDKAYRVLDDTEIPPAPAWLASASGTATADKQDQTPLCELDLIENKIRAESYLATAPTAIQGQSGDATTFNVAAKLKDLGISQHTAVEMLKQLYNPRCVPPWTDKELEKKTDNAYHYATSTPPGIATPEGAAAVVADAFPPIPTTPLEASARRLCDIGLAYPPQSWLVEDWIPAGGSCQTLFTGDGGTGKSQLVLQLGLSLSTGTPWLGLKTTRNPVFYVSCEDDDDEIDRRVFRYRKTNFIDDRAPFWAMSRVGKSSILCIGDKGTVHPGPFYSEIDAQLSQLPDGPKTLILDTAADMFAGNENDRGEASGFMKVILSGLGLKHHATILLIAHPPKNTGKTTSTYSGSTAWNNAVRARLFLRYQDPAKKNDYRVLSLEKSNRGAVGTEILMRYDHGVYTHLEDTVVFSSLETSVLEAIDRASQMGAPLSLRKNGAYWIGEALIQDADGQMRGEDEIVRCAKHLLRDGKIHEKKGLKRNNGLYLGNGMTEGVSPEGETGAEEEGSPFD